MKKLTLLLSAMLLACATNLWADPLGDGYAKVTDISTLSAGDKIVLYADGASLGVTGADNNKDATISETGWVEYVVEAASNGVLLKDVTKNKYIASPGNANVFKYGDVGGICTVDKNGVLCCNNRYLCKNGNNYRMYANIGSYSPFYVYKIVPAVTYSITLNQPKYGEGVISSDKTTAAAGEKVTLTATPSAGYALTNWTVFDGDANEVSVIDNTFIMPESNVEVEGVFAIEEQFDITWKVGNKVYFSNTFKTGQALTLPNTPSVPTTISGKVFMGWTATADYSGNDAPSDLFTTSEDAPIVDINTTFYAVFALKSIIPGQMEETILTTTGFESTEGYSTGTTYNSENYSTGGKESYQWKINYGNFSTNAKHEGSSGAQFRIYSSGGGFGELKNVTAFTNVTKFTYWAKAGADNAKLSLYYSVDKGTNWTAIEENKAVATNSFTEYSAIVNAAGIANVIIRFQAAGDRPTSGNTTLTIDDITVYSMQMGEDKITYLDYSTSTTSAKVSIIYDFNGGEGECENTTAQTNEEYSICATAPTKLGYTFAGWAVEEYIYQAGETLTITENTTFTAQWVINQYTVTFEKNAAEAVGMIEPITQDFNTSITIPNEEYTCDGYVFAGWNTQKEGNGVGYQAGETLLLNQGEDVILYAQWKKIHTIVWKVNNEPLVPEVGEDWTMEVVDGETITLLPPAPKDNTLLGADKFVGWLGQTYTGDDKPDGLFSSTPSEKIYGDKEYHAIFAKAHKSTTPFAIGVSGNFFIAAKIDETYYYANGSVADKKLLSSTQEPTDSYVFTSLGNGNYYIQYGSDYIAYSSGADLKIATEYEWTISQNENTQNGTWRITASTADTRALVFRTETYNYFKAYVTTSIDGSTYFDLEILPGITYSHFISSGTITTGLEDANQAIQRAVKRIENRQLIILRDGVKYNAMGVRLQ